MRGTFSSDLLVDDVFIPNARVGLVKRLHTVDRAPAVKGPLYGTMPWPGIHGETVVSVAIAHCALEKLLELGADYAVDHRKEDWHKEVRSIAKKIPKPLGDVPGVDVIFEHIGGSHWNKELTLLNYGGTIVTTGATTGYDAKTDLRHIFFKGINILGSTQ